jgi:hypothetical protein
MVPEDFIISLMGTQIVEVWRVMEPYIMDERDYRAKNSVDSVPSEFLPHYEYLVVRILKLGGRDAGVNIRRTLGMQYLAQRIGAPTTIPANFQSNTMHSASTQSEAESQPS